jgi:hypothetical protein
MAQPNLPSYLGTWDELVRELLHNPFLGSGHGPGPHGFRSLSDRQGPVPDPGSPASALFVVAAGLKDVVSRLPEGENSQIGSAIVSAADDWEDWFCGNGPRPHPNVIETVGQLLAFAGTLEVGALRTNIVREAGILLEKSFGVTVNQAAQVTSIAS